LASSSITIPVQGKWSVLVQRAIIEQILVGPFQVFTYIVACSRTKSAVIVDPAGEEERLFSLIGKMGAKVAYILITHGHGDHMPANKSLKSLLDAPICLHELDLEFFCRDEIRRATIKDLKFPPPDIVDTALIDEDILEVGDLRIRVIHTSGHTTGSVCYYVDGNLFTGDTLFVGAAGRTDLTGGSLEILLRSLEKKVLTLPKETVIWPGHDYGETPSSTIAREMEDNIYITDFIL
jgi:glyoxylase-like metal-dependent hydrolase (beta-lactamase superfamily II)